MCVYQSRSCFLLIILVRLGNFLQLINFLSPLELLITYINVTLLKNGEQVIAFIHFQNFNSEQIH